MLVLVTMMIISRNDGSRPGQLSSGFPREDGELKHADLFFWASSCRSSQLGPKFLKVGCFCSPRRGGVDYLKAGVGDSGGVLIEKASC